MSKNQKLATGVVEKREPSTTRHWIPSHGPGVFVLVLFLGLMIGLCTGILIAASLASFSSSQNTFFYGGNWAPSLSTTAVTDKRLGVCITGQLERLELKSKVKNLFEVNARNGWTVDAVILLSNASKAEFVNRRVPIVSQTLYSTDESIIKALQPHVKHAKVVRLAQPTDPLMRDEYTAGLDKWNMKDDLRKARARGHVRQWYMLRECMAQLREMELQNGAPYSDFVRVREDSYVFAPLRPIPEIEGAGNVSLITPICDAWSGVNDKAAVFRREAARGYFEGPLDLFYLFGDDLVDNWTAVLRPEKVIREALQWKGVAFEAVAPLDLPVITQRQTEHGSCIDTIMKRCYGRFLNNSDTMRNFRRNWCR